MYGLCNDACQADFVARFRTVRIDRINHQFACSQVFTLACPLNGIQFHRGAPAVDNNFIAGWNLRSGFDLTHIHGKDDCLCSECFGCFGYQAWIFNCCRIDVDFFRACQKHTAAILDSPQPASHGKGDENLFGHLADHIQHDVAVIAGSCYIVEDQLVQSLFII